MYIIFAKWKGDSNADIWEVNRIPNLINAIKMLKVYENGFGDIYHIWIAEERIKNLC